jgi:hypothetical protein
MVMVVTAIINGITGIIKMTMDIIKTEIARIEEI